MNLLYSLILFTKNGRKRDVSITPDVFSDKERIEQSLAVVARENTLGAQAAILNPGCENRIFVIS